MDYNAILDQVGYPPEYNREKAIEAMATVAKKETVDDDSRIKDPNFRQDVFDEKVKQHIKCGYSKEAAEWKVLGDYNRIFLGFMGIKPNKRKTDKNGYYI